MEFNIYLVRHGETVYNTERKMQGWSDSPLTEKGISGAKALGKDLKDIKFDALYTSDLKRAIDTGNLIISENTYETPDFISEGIKEWRFGSLEATQSFLKIKALAEEKLNSQNNNSNYLECFSEAASELDDSNLVEPFEDIKSRIMGTFDIIAEKANKNNWQNVLLVSHGLIVLTTIFIMSNVLIKEIPNLTTIKITYKDGIFTPDLDF